MTELLITARIEGPPFHRGASASKKNGPAAPLAQTARFMISDVLILFAPHPSILPLQARLLSLSWKGTHVGLGAAVERGPS